MRASKMSHHRFVGRRCFLKMSAAAVATALSPVPVFAGFKQLLQDERRLHFYNLHTDERLQVCYCRNGKYDRRALKAVDHILRDHRTDKVHPIEPRLLDLLHAIAVKTGSNRFHVISGYRSPTTNAMLRKDGRKVASRSYHTRGKAIDIRMPDADTRTLYRVTVDLKGGGAGHYAGRNFVHVDVGPVRYW